MQMRMRVTRVIFMGVRVNAEETGSLQQGCVVQNAEGRAFSRNPAGLEDVTTVGDFF